jgi:hypothetical protein
LLGQALHEGRFDDARIARIEAALCPYPWRRMTLGAVARNILVALDRESRELAASDDDLLWIVESALAECRWRALTTAGVARQALAALDSWQARLRWLDFELAWLLAGPE